MKYSWRSKERGRPACHRQFILFRHSHAWGGKGPYRFLFYFVHCLMSKKAKCMLLEMKIIRKLILNSY